MNPLAAYTQMIRERRIALLRDRFIAELAWQYRDRPGDAAWDYTEALADTTAKDTTNE